jgi:hypothetical protein
VPTASYIPLTVTERNSGQTVTVYNQAPSLRGRLDTVWDNDPEMDSTYNGGDLTINKRLSDGWMMTGGISLGKNTGYVGSISTTPARRSSAAASPVTTCRFDTLVGTLRAPMGRVCRNSFSIERVSRMIGVGWQQHRGTDAGHPSVTSRPAATRYRV